jgi:hypothetical protein
VAKLVPYNILSRFSSASAEADVAVHSTATFVPVFLFYIREHWGMWAAVHVAYPRCVANI